MKVMNLQIIDIRLEVKELSFYVMEGHYLIDYTKSPLRCE